MDHRLFVPAGRPSVVLGPNVTEIVGEWAGDRPPWAAVVPRLPAGPNLREASFVPGGHEDRPEVVRFRAGSRSQPRESTGYRRVTLESPQGLRTRFPGDLSQYTQ